MELTSPPASCTALLPTPSAYLRSPFLFPLWACCIHDLTQFKEVPFEYQADGVLRHGMLMVCCGTLLENMLEEGGKYG